MHNPLRGIVTSSYNLNRKHPVSGVRQPHRGLDIAGRPRPAMGKIRAPYAGRVVGVLLPKNWVDRGHNWGLIWGRSGPGVLIRNPDGEHQYIGHPSQIHVKVGDWVNEGDVVATEGDEGRVTGPHLHIEFHNKSSGPSNNWTHTRDPMIDFRAAGITPGVDHIILAAPTEGSTSNSATAEPTPAPLPEPEPAPHFQEEDMLFIWGRTRGRILSGGVFAGVPHSLIIQAYETGVPVIPLTDEAHASLTATFADRTQKVALDQEKDD